MTAPRTPVLIAQDVLIAEAELAGQMAKAAVYLEKSVVLFEAGEDDLAEFANEGAADATRDAETVARMIAALNEEWSAVVAQIAEAN